MATVLVIDDHDGIRNLLDTLLSLKGYEVALASNGQRALKLFPQTPDVVGHPDGSRNRGVRATSAGTGSDRVHRKRVLAASPGGLSEAPPSFPRRDDDEAVVTRT